MLCDDFNNCDFIKGELIIQLTWDRLDLKLVITSPAFNAKIIKRCSLWHIPPAGQTNRNL